MPEDDRFGDLGKPPARSAAERLAERDRIDPEPDDPRRPEVPRPGNRYAWVVGIFMLMSVSVVLFTTALPNSGEGLRGPTVGTQLPDFAAPAATGDLDGDANVRQRGGGGGDAAGTGPACEIVSEQVVNICELREDPLVVTFLVTEGADCEPQIDRVERMRDEFPQVEFVAVMSGEEREDVARIVRRRGWELPVAVDPDGAVVNLYRVGLCPTTVFAAAGGEVEQVEIGNLTEDELRVRVRAVLPTAGA